MAERQQKKLPAPQRHDEEVGEDLPHDKAKEAKIKADLDDLLDEIDGVLEENAEDFVRAYVQKGGQ